MLHISAINLLTRRRMPVRHIDHVLIAMPAGREEDARAFYHGILGIAELAKPPGLPSAEVAGLKAGRSKCILALTKISFRPEKLIQPLSSRVFAISLQK